MELHVGNAINKKPGAEDIVRAIDGAPSSADFSITLDAGNRGSLDAYAEAKGGFSVVAAAPGGTLRSAQPVDAAKLKSVFLKYLKGDASWRSGCAWAGDEIHDLGDDAPDEAPEAEAPAAPPPMTPPPAMPVRPAADVPRATPKPTQGMAFRPASPAKAAPLKRHDPSKLPTWAMAIIGASIGFVIICFEFPSVARHLPYSSSDYFWVGLVFFPIIVLVVVAIAATKLETRAARSWASAPGKIVKSGVAQSRHKYADQTTSVTNVPDIEYEFTVGARTLRSNRVSVGEDSGGPNLEATLKRYPVGAMVTVYYDQKDPTHCALERDMPKGLAKGCLAAIAIVVVLVGSAWLFGAKALQWLESQKIPNAPFVLAITGFGLAMLFFGYAMRKTAMQAKSWPSTPGKIMSSDVEIEEKYEDGRSRTMYAPSVEFAYRVNGVEYRSRQIQLNVTTAAGKGWAEKVAARYPKGASVDVHYDPANPATAALENPTGMYWLIIAGAFVCFGIAALVASGRVFH